MILGNAQLNEFHSIRHRDIQAHSHHCVLTVLDTILFLRRLSVTYCGHKGLMLRFAAAN